MSAMAWAKLGMASVYACMVVMWALYNSVRPMYSASPWGEESTMCAVYAIAHQQPCTPQQASKRLVCWLGNSACWNG